MHAIGLSTNPSKGKQRAPLLQNFGAYWWLHYMADVIVHNMLSLVGHVTHKFPVRWWEPFLDPESLARNLILTSWHPLPLNCHVLMTQKLWARPSWKHKMFLHPNVLKTLRCLHHNVKTDSVFNCPMKLLLLNSCTLFTIKFSNQQPQPLRWLKIENKHEPFTKLNKPYGKYQYRKYLRWGCLGNLPT